MSTEAQRTKLTIGLRRTAIAAIAALLVEYGFGLFLFGTTPKSAHGATLLVAFGRSIASGPVDLVIHAILGTLILLGGVMSMIRAIQSRQAVFIVLNGLGLVTILLAWLAGDATAGDPMGPSGRVMGIMTGIAILAYATSLYLAPRATPAATANQAS